MSKFDEDDLIGRTRFKEDFKKYYIIQDTGSTDRTDIMMTGRTINTPEYCLELKKRYISIYTYSGSTLIEENKLEAFRNILRDEPQRKLIYFNYYLDNHYIAFDISGRLLNEDLMETLTKGVYPQYTSISKGNIEKDVRYLSYTNNEYIQDVLYIRKKN